jgi:hypothetical protein
MIINVNNDIENVLKNLKTSCSHKLIKTIYNDGYNKKISYACKICQLHIDDPSEFIIVETKECQHKLERDIYWDGHCNIRSYWCVLCKKDIIFERNYEIIKTTYSN